MATLVSFHAHPNDDTTTCGGVMRKAHEDGHRVVLVLATRGELGYAPDGFLDDGEELGQRRADEARAAAEILGVDRLEFLDYTDSGMTSEANGSGSTFRNADVEEAAARLAAILFEEDADVLTVYDERGVYGDVDHIQVHRVGMRAAEIAGTPKVFESTINRERVFANQRQFAERAGVPMPPFGPDFGTADADITCSVDVGAYTEHKRKALLAHGSQITPQSTLFTDLPEDQFRTMFGTEWFVRAGQGPGVTETDLMA